MSRKEEKYALRKLKSSYLSTVISVSLVLFMLGLLGLILLHTKKLSDYVKENIGLTVVLKDSIREADINQFQKSLDATHYVKSTEFVNKEQAAETLKQDLGEDFIQFLGYNPLLSSIDVHLKADFANSDSLRWIEKEITKNVNVKEIYYQKSLVDLVNENVKKIGLIILVFSSLLLVISIALINNSIRLSIYSKRFIIRTMQLVGATQGFIRRPFVFSGIRHGIYGALIAIALLIGIIYWAQSEIPELIVLQDVDLFASLFGIVLFLGIFITWICTYFAVRKYLRLKTDDLYY
ncbi:MAG: cell division protein FtsX [Bacteroidetes bacterium]|nr:cell division protein FtsX [Bacteroidota bacterium]MBK9672828.1 cell division protein FtsX [Bacteroidota bacterium]MBK9800938.1 cell division protein FtsX [Bacteroidota bacterium]MBP6412491.1 permease-like cell division protein FtsX [Bacteroidia bacterium]